MEVALPDPAPPFDRGGFWKFTKMGLRRRKPEAQVIAKRTDRFRGRFVVTCRPGSRRSAWSQLLPGPYERHCRFRRAAYSTKDRKRGRPTANYCNAPQGIPLRAQDQYALMNVSRLLRRRAKSVDRSKPQRHKTKTSRSIVLRRPVLSPASKVKNADLRGEIASVGTIE